MDYKLFSKKITKIKKIVNLNLFSSDGAIMFFLLKLFTCFWISFVFGFFGFKMFFSLTTIRRTFIRPLWTITDFRYLSHLLKNNMTTNVHNNDDNVSLCVVGNGADGNPRSLFLDYNDHIFMFNCGEGLQRSICDLGFKPSKIDTFFSTSNRWHNYSGMTSLLLARYDSGSRHLNINNADLNQTFIQYCTVFDTKLKRLKYNYFDDKNFVYENLSIQIVPIVFGNIKTAIYLGTLRAQRGRINLEKCFHQKVPRNLVNELEQNQCVQNQYGQIIHPSDVSDPDRPEQNFLIFECIDKNYLEHLSEHKVINEFIPKCNVMVHFTNDFLTEFHQRRMNVYLANVPMGSSSWNVAHFFQMFEHGQPSRFDYGALINLRKYGSLTPPIYDAGRINSTDMAFIYLANDYFNSLTNVDKLKSKLKGNIFDGRRVIADFTFFPCFICSKLNR